MYFDLRNVGVVKTRTGIGALAVKRFGDAHEGACVNIADETVLETIECIAGLHGSIVQSHTFRRRHVFRITPTGLGFPINAAQSPGPAATALDPTFSDTVMTIAMP